MDQDRGRLPIRRSTSPMSTPFPAPSVEALPWLSLMGSCSRPHPRCFRMRSTIESGSALRGRFRQGLRRGLWLVTRNVRSALPFRAPRRPPRAGRTCHAPWGRCLLPCGRRTKGADVGLLTQNCRLHRPCPSCRCRQLLHRIRHYQPVDRRAFLPHLEGCRLLGQGLRNRRPNLGGRLMDWGLRPGTGRIMY
jgi:hypothetical protein